MRTDTLTVPSTKTWKVGLLKSKLCARLTSVREELNGSCPHIKPIRSALYFLTLSMQRPDVSLSPMAYIHPVSTLLFGP